MNNIFLNNKDKFYSLSFLTVIFLFHLSCLSFYPINDEFIFPIGAKLFETRNISLIKEFFNFNANTLGFSFIIFIISKITLLDYYQIGKLLSSFGLLFIFIGLVNYLNIINFKPKIKIFYLLLLIFLNM